MNFDHSHQELEMGLILSSQYYKFNLKGRNEVLKKTSYLGSPGIFDIKIV